MVGKSKIFLFFFRKNRTGKKFKATSEPGKTFQAREQKLHLQGIKLSIMELLKNIEFLEGFLPLGKIKKNGTFQSRFDFNLFKSFLQPIGKKTPIGIIIYYEKKNGEMGPVGALQIGG